MKAKIPLKERVFEREMSNEEINVFCPRVRRVYTRFNELKQRREQENLSSTPLEAEFVMAYVILYLDTLFPNGRCLTGPADKAKLAISHQNFQSNTNWKTLNRTQPSNDTSADTSTTSSIKPHIQDLEDQPPIHKRPDLWDKHNHLCTGDLFESGIPPEFQNKITRYLGKDISLQKRMKGGSEEVTTADVPLVHVVAEVMLMKVPDFVRHSLLEWAYGNRPGVMMTYSPTPHMLFELMCDKKRCVSCLLTEEELSTVILDDYPPFEKRNTLSFLFHDVKHLEKFVDPAFYNEQVAFLKFMRPLCSPNPNSVHCIREDLIATYDEEFAADMDHLLADMNACSPHLVQFLKAKWINVRYRRCAREEPENTNTKLSPEQVQRLSDTRFVDLFNTWQSCVERANEISAEDWNDLRVSFGKICSEDYTFPDSEKIRKFFVAYAQLVV